MMRVAARSLGLFCLSLCLVAAGCRKAEKAEKEGQELSKNPLVAMGQINEAAKKVAEAAKETQELKPVEPVHFSKLIDLLPPPPAGWTAVGEPTGETQSGMGFKISQVERNYSSGEKHLRVHLTDGAFNSPLYAGVTMAAQFARETPQGYEKGVTLDGNPGVEKFRKSGGHVDLTLLVARRFLVTIEASGVDQDFARSLWSRMDRAKLLALK